jgi:hypothetical protein
MSEIVNLKRYRKRLARDEKDAKAKTNRDRFGRSKAERVKTETEKDLAARRLDLHKREE